MNAEETLAARLREGLASLGETASPGPDCPEPDRLWAAAAGEGTPAERQEVVLHLSTCASCATAFRLARGLVPGARSARDDEAASPTHHLGPEESEADGGAKVVPLSPPVRADQPGRRSWIRVGGGLAALAAGVILALAIPRLRPAPEPPYRGGEGAAVRSLLPAGSVLERDRAELRWTPGPPGSRYEVRVLTAQGEELAVEGGLDEPRYRIPPGAIAGRPPGDELLWQVTVVGPDGSGTTSPTFTARLQ